MRPAAARRSLDGVRLDRHVETNASRQITSTLAYVHAAGDIVAIVGKGPGGLHALRWLLGHARMMAQAVGRDAIDAGDIAAATDEGAAADDRAPINTVH